MGGKDREREKIQRMLGENKGEEFREDRERKERRNKGEGQSQLLCYWRQTHG